MKVLTRNIKIIAEAIVRHTFNLSVGCLDAGGTYVHNSSSSACAQGDGVDYEVFPGLQSVHVEHVNSWLDLLSSHPRSPQLLVDNHQLVIGLEQVGVAFAAGAILQYCPYCLLSRQCPATYKMSLHSHTDLRKGICMTTMLMYLDD